MTGISAISKKYQKAEERHTNVSENFTLTTKNSNFNNHSFGSGGDQPKASCEVYTKQNKKGALLPKGTAPFSLSENPRKAPSIANGRITPLLSSRRPSAKPKKEKTLADREYLWQMKKAAGEIFGGSTQNCGCTLSFGANAAGISRTGEQFHFNNVVTCKNTWLCPSCSVKIKAKRAAEIKTIFQAAEKRDIELKNEGKQGLCHAHIILTTRHKSHETAKEVIERLLKKSWRKIQDCREWKKQKIDFIRTVEITYSFNNGWHPHLHFYATSEQRFEELESFFNGWLVPKWIALNENNTLPENQQIHNAAQIDYRTNLQTYIGKELSLELTQSNNKRARGEGLTPFGMLHEIINPQTEYSNGEIAHFEMKLKEYQKAIRSVKQTHYSKGIFEKYLSVEKTDEDLINEIEDTQQVLTISGDLFYTICRKHAQAMTLYSYQLIGVSGVIRKLIRFGILTAYNAETNTLELQKDYKPIPIVPKKKSYTQMSFLTSRSVYQSSEF